MKLVPLGDRVVLKELKAEETTRCYHGGEGRTQMKPLRYQTRDYAAYGILMAYLVCSIGLRVCGL